VTLTLGEIAVRYGCELQGDPDTAVSAVATLAGAGRGDIAFLANPGYRKKLADTAASAVILAPGDAEDCPVACLISANPYAVYARVAQELYPDPPPVPGVHASATVADDCQLGADVEISAGAVIGAGVSIGDRCYIGPNTVIANGARIGSDTRLLANVTIYDGVSLGDRCRIHAGTVIGSDGFGIAPDESGWAKVPQVGSVVVGDDVEIGANSCVDRGAIDDTRIGDDVKIDNQVQIAHNVVVGAHTAIAGQAGVAGSTTIGQRCLIGGASSVSGHITIADNVSIMGSGNVSKSITEPGVYSGVLSVEHVGKWRKIAARVKRLDNMAGKLRELEAKVKKLAGGRDDSS